MKRLTEVAQFDRDEFVEIYGPTGNCSCHNHPPCDSCIHPGNPHNQEEDDCWEDIPFDELIPIYLEWVNKTFPGETVDAQFKHLWEEIAEFKLNPADPGEIADVLMLLVCVANGQGIDILEAFRAKFAINRNRKWAKTDRGWRHA